MSFNSSGDSWFPHYFVLMFDRQIFDVHLHTTGALTLILHNCTRPRRARNMRKPVGCNSTLHRDHHSSNLFCVPSRAAIIKLRRRKIIETVMPSAEIITCFIRFNERATGKSPKKLWLTLYGKQNQDSIVRRNSIEKSVIDHWRSVIAHTD